MLKENDLAKVNALIKERERLTKFINIRAPYILAIPVQGRSMHMWSDTYEYLGSLPEDTNKVIRKSLIDRVDSINEQLSNLGVWTGKV